MLPIFSKHSKSKYFILQERKRISKYVTHMDTTIARIAYLCNICSGGIMIPICYQKYEKNKYTIARLQV